MTKILILGATGNLAGLATAALAGAKDVQLRLAGASPPWSAICTK